MARYYFHLEDRFGRTEDETGQELADAADVRSRAIKAARSIMQADVETGFVDLTAQIVVAAGGGELVMTIPFGEAVELILNARAC